MTTLAEKIAVMQAFERGEKIESRRFGGKEWECVIPGWNWIDCDYRIAQKPKKTVELYQYLLKHGDGYYLTAHQSFVPIGAIRRLDETRMVVEVEE